MELPLYLKLSNELKYQIITGDFKAGDLLPSESDMRKSHNLNRATIRQALNELVKEGYISKHKGKGSIVTEREASLELLSIKGFSEVLGKKSDDVSTQIITHPHCNKWPENFFYSLSTEEIEAGCIYMKRLRFYEQDSVMLEDTYLADLGLSNLYEQDLIRGSLFQSLNFFYQITISNVEQEIKAVIADTSLSKTFKIQKGAPLLHIYRKYFTNRNGLNIYSSLYINTEKYRIGYKFQ